MKLLAVASLLVLALVPTVSSSRILFVSAIASKSHKGFFTSVVNSLADNGHQVTIISPFRPSKPRKNVREIVLDDLDVTKVLPSFFAGGTIGGPMSLLGTVPKLCSDALAKNEVQDLLKEEFDLGMTSIFLSDCFLSLFHQLKVPYIQVCPAGFIGSLSRMMGNPMLPSFVKSPMLHISHPFTFAERLTNTAAETLMDAVFEYYLVPNLESECRQRGLCPKDMPNFHEMRANSSLLIVNSVRSAETPPRPIVPSVVYAGGIHYRKAKPLPQDLEDWVAGAGEAGFIFFSLGSVVTPSSMPEEYRKTLVKTFGSLKQRVLWKWDQDTMEDLPPNVRLQKWLPQQDILGDPRLKLFITHGGFLSTQESIYHGIPVLGLPVFGDQVANMAEVESQGWGKFLRFEELSPELLKETMHSVMTDEKLRAEVKRRSVLMRDVPQDPAQTMNFWVDYVIRHKGASHLRSPILSLSWYQLYNVDVWLTILTVVFVIGYIFVKLLLVLLRCCIPSKKKSKKD